MFRIFILASIWCGSIFAGEYLETEVATPTDEVGCAANVVSGDNYVQGCGNVVSGVGNVVYGHYNVVSGVNNRVCGNNQVVSGVNGNFGCR